MTSRAGDLDPAASVPLYAQVAQQIRQDIYSRVYKSGHMLPSEGKLRALYGVSAETIRNALEMLRREGLLETRRGAGSRVLSVPSPVTVTAGPGDIIRAKTPTRAEREKLGVAEGVPVLTVLRPGRAEPELFDANRTEIIWRD